MQKFLAAIRFLTIIPIPGKMGHDNASLSGSLPFFSLVGLLIGAVGAVLSQGLMALFPQPVVAVLTVVVLLAVSGGLHMDGLSDTADGFFSARSRERMLEIMRDSRAGAMGVMAIVVVLALKIAALSTMPLERMTGAVFLMPIAGRVSLLACMALLPYARPEGGMATLFYSQSSKVAAMWGTALLCIAGLLATGRIGLFACVLTMGFVFVFAMYCRKKIGGATGDTLGGGCELAETMIVLIFSIHA
jgi:adenosylcobinamide-GDP ribazoletransferase